MGTSLHDLTTRYAHTLESIDEAEGEVSPDAEAVLDSLAVDLPQKIEALAGVRARYLAHAEACDQLAKQYHARSVAQGKQVERVEAYVQRCMLDGRMHKLKGATATVWLAESQRVIVRCAPEELPAQYRREKPAVIEADKKALGDALKAGEAVEGVELETSVSVRFR